MGNIEYTKQLEESHEALQKKLEDTQEKLRGMAMNHLHMRRLIDIMRKSYIDMKMESDDCRYWMKAAKVDTLMGFDRENGKRNVPDGHTEAYQYEYEKYLKEYQKEFGITLEENMRFIKECFGFTEYNSLL